MRHKIFYGILFLVFASLAISCTRKKPEEHQAVQSDEAFIEKWKIKKDALDSLLVTLDKLGVEKFTSAAGEDAQQRRVAFESKENAAISSFSKEHGIPEAEILSFVKSRKRKQFDKYVK